MRAGSVGDVCRCERQGVGGGGGRDSEGETKGRGRHLREESGQGKGLWCVPSGRLNVCVGVHVFVCVEGSGHEGRWWRGVGEAGGSLQTQLC